MLKRVMFGGSSLLLAVLAIGSTRAEACGRDCVYPPYRLPHYFAHPLKTTWVYYPRNYRRHWGHVRKVHCRPRYHYCDHRW